MVWDGLLLSFLELGIGGSWFWLIAVTGFWILGTMGDGLIDDGFPFCGKENEF